MLNKEAFTVYGFSKFTKFIKEVITHTPGL